MSFSVALRGSIQLAGHVGGHSWHGQRGIRRNMERVTWRNGRGQRYGYLGAARRQRRRACDRHLGGGQRRQSVERKLASASRVRADLQRDLDDAGGEGPTGPPREFAPDGSFRTGAHPRCKRNVADGKQRARRVDYPRLRVAIVEFTAPRNRKSWLNRP